jgi:hypothetical protein
MRLAFAALCALLGYCAVAPPTIADEATAVIPLTWLQEKMTLAEAEAEHPGITDERKERFPEAAKPFGFQHQKWEEFKAAMLPGDELWAFSSPADSWKHLAGRSGIALVRGGVPIRIIVTLMS